MLSRLAGACCPSLCLSRDGFWPHRLCHCPQGAAGRDSPSQHNPRRPICCALPSHACPRLGWVMQPAGSSSELGKPPGEQEPGPAGPAAGRSELAPNQDSSERCGSSRCFTVKLRSRFPAPTARGSTGPRELPAAASWVWVHLGFAPFFQLLSLFLAGEQCNTVMPEP